MLLQQKASGRSVLANSRTRSTRTVPTRHIVVANATDQEKPSTSAPGPVELVQWGGTIPSRRRFIGGTLTGLVIALGGNLGGISSALLGLDNGQLAASLKLDVIFPVQGCLRCYDPKNGFEFLYPSRWMGDLTVAQRAAKRAEEARSLDPPRLQKRRDVAEPCAAFGPAGTSGEENVSVIVAPIFQGFTLQALGSPERAAQEFMENIAPAGSDKQATLLSATARTDPSGVLYYEMEYTIRGPNFNRHNVSVYCSRNNRLYTFNAQCPEGEAWERDAPQLRSSAASFRLLS